MINKTSLYNKHLDLGAKLVSFSGFKMPVNYSKGIFHEYNSIRNKCGIFDVYIADILNFSHNRFILFCSFKFCQF